MQDELKPEYSGPQISREDIIAAARVLKTKGSKKREKRKAAGVMGLVGGAKGGHNRARNLTPEQRREIARMGGLARQAARRQAAAETKQAKARESSARL